MADPFAHWAHGIHSKTERERQMVHKMYEKLFQDVVAVISFTARHGSDRFCVVEVPANPLVDRNVLRDYCIRRLVKLNFTVSIPTPSSHPFHICVSWIQSNTSNLQTDEEYDGFASSKPRDSEDEDGEEEEEGDDDESEEEEDSDSKRKKGKISRGVLDFLRAVANPSKIIGE